VKWPCCTYCENPAVLIIEILPGVGLQACFTCWLFEGPNAHVRRPATWNTEPAEPVAA